jgi:hypothetical protein
MAAAALALALLLASALPDGIQNVKASELLMRAERAEEVRQRTADHDQRLYRIQDNVNNLTCQLTDSVWRPVTIHAASECESAHNLFLKSRWNVKDPLSVRSFRDWHDSLVTHRDSVVQDSLYSTIRTETSQGGTFVASLRVISSNYRPVELRLEFAGAHEISVEAYGAGTTEIQTRAYGGTDPATSATPGGNSAALDDAEARAWLVLHAVGADSGWDAAVVRTAKSVVVVNSVPGLRDQEQLREAFRRLDETHIEIQQAASSGANDRTIWPRRAPTGSSLPLAEGLLEARFPDAADRSHFVTELSGLSKCVIGYAFEYERLRARKRAWGSSSRSADLDTMIRGYRTRLDLEMRSEAELASKILGPIRPAETQRSISYKEARDLDSGFLALFEAAPSSSDSREQIFEHLKRLLAIRNSQP